MKAYIDSMIDMRYVRASFNAGAGRDGFCVDFDKQPSCLASPGACPASPRNPPPLPPSPATQHSTSEVAAKPICPHGTVPIARPRLETMLRFATLEDFQRGWKGAPPNPRKTE
jgi:hypothetical protein